MPLTRRTSYFIGSAVLSAACALGCSASGGKTSNVRGAGGDGSTGTGASTGSSAGSSSTVGNGGNLNIDTGNGEGNGAGSGGIAGGDQCAGTSQQASTVPLSMFILLDQSGSMQQEGNRWTPVTSALKTFLSGTSIAGVGVGLQYFPLGATTTSDQKICNSTNYVTPGVAIADMPGNDTPLATSIDGHYFTAAQGGDAAHWGTPTYPALQGSYEYLRQYLMANPDRHGVLLLATDGEPSKLCMGDTVDEITALIGAQATMTPPIQTYVIGIGQVASLNNWAMAGGTGHAAFITDGSGSTTQDDLAKALDSIRQLTLPCDYDIPTPDGGMIDPDKVNVQFTPPGGAASVFPRVDNMAACDAMQPTWYYDNPTAPTKVEMCPVACNTLHQASAKIDILFGCKTEIFNPPR